MDRAAMDRLLATTEAQLERAWLAMIGHVREVNSVTQIAGRMQVRDPGAVLDDVSEAAASFAAAEHNAYVGAAQTTARWLRRQFGKRDTSVVPGDERLGRLAVPTLDRPAIWLAKKLLNFDPGDATALSWAERNQLDLIREITREQRVLIRDALIGGAASGVNPRITAADIRDAIGLTAAQERAVQSYRAALERGQYAAALQRQLSSGVSDRTIVAAQAAGRELTQAQIDTAVARYRENFVRLRAETIARTEALRVAHQGTEELYRQAIARGDLQADQLERTWNHSPGAKKKSNERAFHRSMHGQTHPYGEVFVSGLGAELRYPGDPEADAEETVNCRCVLSTRLAGAGTAAADNGLPGGAGAGDEEVVAPNEAAFEDELGGEEDAALEEGAAEDDAAVGDEVAAGEGAELDTEAARDAAEPDLGLGTESDPFLPSLSPSGAWQQAQQQQLQRAQRRLAERQAAHATTRADLEASTAAHEQATAELEAAQREVDGFRVGASRIAGETELDEVDWLREQRAAVTPAAAPASAESEPRAAVVPSDKPAPLGYEAIEYDGELYYRHRISGRSYTPAQYTERTRDPNYHFDLVGPNEQIPGFQAYEARSRHMAEQGRPAEVRYRSLTTDSSYTAEQVASGEAAETEAFLLEEQAKPAPRRGLLRRLRDAVLGSA